MEDRVSIEELPDMLTAEEVSQYLRLGKVSTYKLLKSEGFPSLYINKRVVVPKQAFLQWIDSNISEKKEV